MFLDGVDEIERILKAAASKSGEARAVRKRMRADGYSKIEVDYALFLRKKKDDPAQVEEQRRARERVAKWMARPEGFQGGLFDGAGDGVLRMPAKERAYEEGKVAGLAGETAKPPYDASTDQGQSWLVGHADGQAVRLKGFKTLEQKPKEGEPGFVDDAEAGTPSMRSRGNPGRGMPSAKADEGDAEGAPAEEVVH